MLNSAHLKKTDFELLHFPGVFRIVQKCHNGGGMLRWVRRRLIFEKVGAWEKL